MELLEQMSLNGNWELRDEILTYDLSNARALSHLAEGWIPTPVPGDIHQGLVAAGRIAEPLLGLNSFDCHWTEQRSWWFRKTFTVGAHGRAPLHLLHFPLNVILRTKGTKNLVFQTAEVPTQDKRDPSLRSG